MSVTFYNREILKTFTRWRWGEEKLGEVAPTVDSWEALKESEARYVLVGVPEDIGVRANMGKAGTAQAWKEGLGALCNIQSNRLVAASNMVILGEIDFSTEMAEARALEEDDPFYPTKIGSLIKDIDDRVTEVVSTISGLNKIPILIGGGHNNAYGNLKGTSQVFGKPMNCINMDAHTDFRPLEHRHSGNGFSYAMEEGYLNKYYILGIHRNYTSETILERMDAVKDQVTYRFFDDVDKRSKRGFQELLLEAKKYSAQDQFGLELDMDAIAHMGSSAMSPEGFTLGQARQYIKYFAGHKNCAYIHICEGAPNLEVYPGQVAKALAYLISEIISK